jgi:hypothetical protein
MKRVYMMDAACWNGINSWIPNGLMSAVTALCDPGCLFRRLDMLLVALVVVMEK